MSETTDNKLESYPVNRTNGAREMSLAFEMQESIQALAGSADRKHGQNRESMIAHAARQAGITFRQAKTFFYAESENPRGKAIEAVRAAVAKIQRDRAAAERAAILKRQEEAASDELTELRERVARIEQLLGARTSNRSRSGNPLDGPENSNRG